MFHIGWCPFCNQGRVDVVKDIKHNELLLSCNECDTMWKNPIDFHDGNPMIDEA